MRKRFSERGSELEAETLKLKPEPPNYGFHFDNFLFNLNLEGSETKP